jgi:Ca2+-binding RTX toxin-like protein
MAWWPARMSDQEFARMPQASESFVTNNIKWGDDSFGTSGGVVTWSVAAANYPEQPFSFSGFLTGDFVTATREAFDAWEAVADIDFVEVSDSSGVDIRLGFDAIDGSSGVLAQAFFSFVGVTLVESTIGFDNAENYVVGDGNVGAGNVNYKTVAIHEIGHAIGISHSEVSPAIMQAFIDDNVNVLQSDDIAAAQFLYGAAIGATTGGTTTPTVVTTPTSTVGTDAADNLTGATGDDNISGGNGADLISGNSGNDVIYGNKETDTIFGNDGADTIFGGQNNGPETSNNGSVAQRQGADVLNGGSGADLIYGNHGGDSITGGTGDDTVFGGQDNDTIVGGAGNDLLNGNKNNDIISGDGGNDTIVGGSGDDTLTGGGFGSDRFRFSSDSGVDVITDEFTSILFDRYEIQTNINGTGVSTGADILARITDDAAGQAVLDLGNGNSVTFQGVSENFFLASDFEFF